MPEPGEVKQGLVWTGTAWVQLRPAEEPSLEVTPSPNTEHRATASDSQHSSSKPGVICPICHQHDRLVRIGGLLDSSTSFSSGYTVATGVGIGSGGLGVGVGDAITESTSTTRLAQRFEIPKPPVYGGCAMILIVFGVAAVGAALTGLWAGFETPAGIIVVLLAVVGALWWIFPYDRFNRRWIKIDKEVLDEVRHGYFCERDTVAFSKEHPNPALPEDFVDQLYEPYLPRLRDEINAVPLLKYLPSMRKISSGKVRFTAPPKS